MNHKDILKVLWYSYLGGVSFTLFYLLKLVVVSALFEFLKDTESGEKGEVGEELGTSIALTTAMSEEQQPIVVTWGKLLFFPVILGSFMLISGITTFPIACSSSLILQAIFVYPSGECDLPVEKETSLEEELVLEPKRFPAGAAIFFVIIILSKLLLYRSGGTSGTTLTNYPDFYPFRVFNPKYFTFVYREKVDEVSVLTIDSVDARNLEYAEALNSECERLYWIHFFDL